MTATIKMECRLSGVLTDATSATCRVVDPIGTEVVADVAMTKTATGKYEYLYDVADTALLGRYAAIVYATVSTHKYAEHTTFEVDWK